MRMSLLASALGALILITWGCGGNVVVDVASTSTGGSTTSSSSSSSGSSFTCNLVCSGAFNACGCTGSCSDGQARSVDCSVATATGYICTCSANGQVVGQCNNPSLTCSLPGSCCQGVFGG